MFQYDQLKFLWKMNGKGRHIAFLRHSWKNKIRAAIFTAIAEKYFHESERRAILRNRAESRNTVSFLKYLHKKCKGLKLSVIWDMATYHRYAEMKKYLKEINNGPEEKDRKITCIFLNRMRLIRTLLRISG